MDPATILGVASSAIQIVDFSVRFLARAKELYDSETGEVKEFSHMQSEAKRLLSLNKSLIDALETQRKARKLTSLEKDILSLCKRSNDVALELLQELNKVFLAGRKDRAVDALKAAFKSLWRQKEIKNLQRQLLDLRDMLSSTILANMQHDMLLGAQKTYDSSLQSWNDTQNLQDWIESQKKDVEELQKKLLDAVSLSQWRVLENMRTEREGELKSWDDSPVLQTLTSSLLDRLAYREIDDREERISQAFEKTFEWIFSDPLVTEDPDHSRSSFRTWLTDGTGIYWITGKAGSGKSTLMKMLCHDRRTTELIKRWSGNIPVVTASFYFWNSGTELQVSQEGLLRSILHQALSKRLRLSPKSCISSKWGAFSLSVSQSISASASQYLDATKQLSWEDLVQACRFLVEEAPDSTINYVFFIDGLDEYLGDHSKITALMKQLASYTNVKICLSSRPWIVFEDAFKQQPNLLLQHRTYGDISYYANQQLSSNPAFRELREYNPVYASDLVQNITTKASGVFLWVVLVVRSLLEGLTQGDKPVELQNRLDELPDELDALFNKMLHGT